MAQPGVTHPMAPAPASTPAPALPQPPPASSLSSSQPGHGSGSASVPVKAAASAVSASVEERAMEAAVLEFLKKRGYTHTADILKQEAAGEAIAATTASSASSANSSHPTPAAPAPVPAPAPSTPDVHAYCADLSLEQHTHLLQTIRTWSAAESTPLAFIDSYAHLSRWVAGTLDVYRREITPILWPLFAHVFMQLMHKGFPMAAHAFLSSHRSAHEARHSAELHLLQNVSTDSELQKVDLVRWLQQRRVEVSMSSYSHQMIITFITEHKYIALLKIVFDHTHIKIVSRRPLLLDDDDVLSASRGASAASVAAALPSSGATSLHPVVVANVNSVPIRYGMLPEQAALHAEAADALRTRMREAQLATKMARLQEEKEKAEAAEARKRREAEQKEAAKAAGKEGEDADESAKKKAKTEGGAAAAAAADTEMTPADGAAAAPAAAAAGADVAADKGKKKTDKSKKKDGAAADGAIARGDPLRETKAEQEAIEATVRQRISQPEAMAVPKQEEQVVKVPPIPADARARYLAALHFRQQLSPTNLPSICLYTFLNAASAVNCMSIGADGALVSCGMSDSTVRLYDVRDSQVHSTNPAARHAITSESKEDSTVLPGAYNDDNLPSFSHITASLLPHRRFLDDPIKLPYSKLVGHAGPVYATSLSPEGQYLLSGSEDCTVRLWHLQTKRNVVIYRGHNYPVWDVAFAPVGYYFATASHDHTARLWSTNHITPLRLFVGHSSDVDVVRFHPNCNYVCTASSDETARLWDVQTGECVRVMLGHKGPVTSLAMDPTGRYAATGGEDGKVMVWDLGSGRQVNAIQAHSAPVTALEYSADAELLASGSMDESLALMEPKKTAQAPLRVFKTKRTPVHFLSFTPRNLLLAGGVFHAE